MPDTIAMQIYSIITKTHGFIRQKRLWWIKAPIIVICLLFTAFHVSDASDVSSSFSIYTSEIRDIKGVKISIDLAWTLLCGFLVFNMQAGFAFLGAGFLQKKNTLNYLAMSFMDFCIGAIVFWAFGFALMSGLTCSIAFFTFSCHCLYSFLSLDNCF